MTLQEQTSVREGIAEASMWAGPLTAAAFILVLTCGVGRGAALAQDSTPPTLTELNLPATVDVTNGPAALTIDYALTDDVSGATYVQVVLMPPGQGCGGSGSVPAPQEGFAATLARSGTVSGQFGQFNTPIGEWTVCLVNLTDAVGNYRSYVTADLIGLGFATHFTVTGVQDTSPPTLTGFSLPAMVDVTNGPAALTIDYALTDDVSGATYVQVVLMPPGQGCGGSGSVPAPQEGFAATLARSGTVSGQFGQFNTPIGEWTVCLVNLTDAVGNYRSYVTADLMGLGFATHFTVTGVQDTSPPTLTGFSLPAMVDVTNGPAALTIDYALTDDVSGATYVQVVLMPPGQGCGGSGSVPAPQEGFAATLARSGTVSGQFGQFNTPIGEWTVCLVNLTDAVGNYRSYVTADLIGLGFATHFTVTGVQDTSPPTLTGFSLPAMVDVTNGPAALTIDYALTDDVSGATYVQVVLMPPGQGCGGSGSVPAPQEGFAATLARSGTVSGQFGQFNTPIGEWTVCLVNLTDAVGNYRSYVTADLMGLGFPTQFAVTGLQDTTAPQLTALDMDPDTVNLADGPYRVRVTYAVTDDLSGANHTYVAFAPTGESCGRGVGETFTSSNQRTASRSFIVGHHRSLPGVWPVCRVDLCDAVGNCRNIDGPGLAALDLSRALTVVDEPVAMPPPSRDLTGEYQGTAYDPPYAISVALSVVQSGSSIEGTAQLSGADCLRNPVVSGRVAGNVVVGTLTEGDQRVEFRVEADGPNLVGVYEIVQGCLTGTAGDVVFVVQHTPMPTATDIDTPTVTSTPTSTFTRTTTATRTQTRTRTEAATHTVSSTATSTPSATVSPTPTNSRTLTVTPTQTPTPTVTPTPVLCVGDCNGNNRVTVDELVRGVNIALGTAPLEQCGAFDGDGSTAITVDELVEGVNAALCGCGIVCPTPRPTATSTNTRELS